jgi:hypothetical protein
MISNEKDNINSIGQFHSFIENKILIICNELQSIDTANHLKAESLKFLMRDQFSTIEFKCLGIRSISKLLNFIFEGNNHLPIEIENDDRRYQILKSIDGANGNFGYYADLHNQFDSQ